MIVKNEEDVLERCLKSVEKFVSEIIIVDTGSTDKTKQIALKFTKKVYDFKWVNDFSKARNFGFKKATCPYILWLDADDVIEEDQQKNWKEMLENLEDADVIMLPYDLAFDKYNKSAYFCYRERIVKNNGKYLFKDPVHEAIIPFGKVVYKKARVAHRKMHTNPPKRNLKIYKQLKKQGITFTPRQNYYYARELYFNNYIKQAKKEFDKFIKLKQGWNENLVDACIIKSYCHNTLYEPDLQIQSLFNAFLFDKPRSDVCCEIGNYFINLKQYDNAIFWFENAIKLQYAGKGFVQKDYFDFIPFMQLCVCHSYFKHYKTAYHYHLLSKQINPEHSSVKYNEKYFEKIKEKGMLKDFS